jgi:hypothetical protein
VEGPWHLGPKPSLTKSTGDLVHTCFPHLALFFNVALDRQNQDYKFAQFTFAPILQDLLAPEHDNLALREGPSGVYVEGVREEEVADIETCLKHLQIGERNRSGLL